MSTRVSKLIEGIDRFAHVCSYCSKQELEYRIKTLKTMRQKETLENRKWLIDQLIDLAEWLEDLRFSVPKQLEVATS